MHEKFVNTLSGGLPLLALVTFLAVPALVPHPAYAAGSGCVFAGQEYSTGACSSNDCTEGSQYCLANGTWDSCGSC